MKNLIFILMVLIFTSCVNVKTTSNFPTNFEEAEEWFDNQHKSLEIKNIPFKKESLTQK
jgi:hypothetical protein